MPAMLIRHTVMDFAAWKSHFDAQWLVRRANGSRGERVFRIADHADAVLIFLEWDDLERARFFANSDDLREVLERTGTTDRPDIWFLEDLDRPSV